MSFRLEVSMADIGGYYTLEAGDNTLSADGIFTQYNKGLTYLVQLVETCPEQFSTELVKVFPVDPYCQCQLGMKPRSNVSCVHCTQIRRLMDYRYVAPDTEFVVASGKYSGKQLMTVEYEKVGCTVTMHDKVVILDKFTLCNLIHCYLYQKLLTVGFHTILPCYTAFVCSTNGYKLVRCSEPLSSVMVDDLSCQQVLKQIATTLDYLTYVNFHRRNLCADDWRVINQPIAYSYKGVNVNAPFRVVLADFSDSTIRVGDKWYIDYQAQNSMYNRNRPLTGITDDTFRLTPSTIDEFHYQRGLGQWNNGSYLWCSYLMSLWNKLACCSRTTELAQLFPSGTDSYFYQDLPQNGLATTLERMSQW